IIGEYDGNLNHYEQSSIGSTEFMLVTENFLDLDVGEKSRPMFVDINNDGYDDFIVGSTEGGIHYYQRNIETFVDEKLLSGTHNPSFALLQNYPNPFNPSTRIKYSIPKHSNVTLKIFDVLGSEVTTLVNKEQTQGNYEFEFDGGELTSGIYFYRLLVGDYMETKKMILLK
ncbi:MAG: T9SS type A sorting domain-containing protein, partial [Melioribacteraceae bacterium]|nr:T9SS type A sorting domain-containing protein [Melioribacteraceae bacterium]